MPAVMPKHKKPNFGQLIREQRRRLGLTQREIALRVGTSTPYLGHLEGNKRHPSDKVLGRLSEVLGLDRRDLYLIANPIAEELLRASKSEDGKVVWDIFRKDRYLKSVHNITPDEMKLLSKVAAMGEFRSPRDLIYVLNAVRYTLRR